MCKYFKFFSQSNFSPHQFWWKKKYKKPVLDLPTSWKNPYVLKLFERFKKCLRGNFIWKSSLQIFRGVIIYLPKIIWTSRFRCSLSFVLRNTPILFWGGFSCFRQILLRSKRLPTGEMQILLCSVDFVWRSQSPVKLLDQARMGEQRFIPFPAPFRKIRGCRFYWRSCEICIIKLVVCLSSVASRGRCFTSPPSTGSSRFLLSWSLVGSSRTSSAVGNVHPICPT